LVMFAAGGAGAESAHAENPHAAVWSKTGGSATAARMKTVEYDGYSVSVPSGWPVYRLDSNPTQCVRYDISAVYLGNPGINQECPPGLIGRAATISITAAGVSGTPPVDYKRAAVSQGGLGGSLPPASPESSAAALPAVQGSVQQYTEQDEFHAMMPHLSVTATYGGDPSQVEWVLRSMRRLRSGQAAGTAGAPGRPAPAGATDPPARPGLADPLAAPAKPSLSAEPASSAEPAASRSPEPAASAPAESAASPGSGASPARKLTAQVQTAGPDSPMNGFDTCTAPSISAMQAWRSKYSAVGIYIGGQNMACDYGNLSASWVASTHAMGWSLLPIYVGLQAPCNSFPGKINAKSAGSQGKTAADTAIGDANQFGMGERTPIYFDMEAYDTTKAGCRTAVLTFLDAWTRELHARGYVSGVYSSAASGVADLVSATAINGHALAEPNAIWFALWDNNNDLVGTPYLPASRWTSNRVKQYMGGHTQKIGGHSLDIDSDRVGGAVSGP
jgi:hypothetical protein